MDLADDAGPEALGGIMGGERSGCTAGTTEVFLEAARMVLRRVPQTHFIIIGDGPRKKHLLNLPP